MLQSVARTRISMPFTLVSWKKIIAIEHLGDTYECPWAGVMTIGYRNHGQFTIWYLSNISFVWWSWRFDAQANPCPIRWNKHDRHFQDKSKTTLQIANLFDFMFLSLFHLPIYELDFLWPIHDFISCLKYRHYLMYINNPWPFFVRSFHGI